MEIKISEKQIKELVDRIKFFENDRKYNEELYLKAKREDKPEFMVDFFANKAELYMQKITNTFEVLKVISPKLYEMVKNEVEAN